MKEIVYSSRPAALRQLLPPPAPPAPRDHLASLCFATLFLMSGLCAFGLCCELSGCVRAAQPEKTLRSEPLLPKLNREQGEPEVTLPLPEPPANLPENKEALPRVLPQVETMTPLRPEEPSAALALPPLVSVRDEAPVPLIPPPTVVPTPEPPQLEAIVLPVARPEPPAVVFVEVCSEPLVYPHPCGPQLLESPMLRNWKTLALYSLLAAAVPAPPAPAQAPNLTAKDLESLQKRLDQLEQKDQTRVDALDKIQKDLKQLDDIRKELARLEQLESVQKDVTALAGRLQVVEDRKAPAPANNPEIRGDLKKLEEMLNRVLDLQKTMQEDVQGVRKDVTGLKKDVITLQGDQAGAKLRLDGLELQISKLTDDLKSLQKRLELGTTVTSSAASANGLEKALDDIRTKLGSIEQLLLRMQSTSSRTAMYAPGTAPTVGTGRVLLENFYPEDMLFIVNGKQTRVLPNQTVALDAVPLGTLSYEVISPSWGSRAQNRTNLVANETFRITAR